MAQQKCLKAIKVNNNKGEDIKVRTKFISVNRKQVIVTYILCV